MGVAVSLTLAERDSYAGRGGGALSDAARSVIVFTRERPDGKQGGEADPLAPVTMTHAKATLSRPAGKILWKPVETSSGGVYLRALSDDEAARGNAQRLLRAMPPEGLSAREIHNGKPGGLGRAAAKEALSWLTENGMVEETNAERGRQKATIYVPKRSEP